MLKAHSNKKIVQDDIRRMSDKVVTLRDLSNYSAKLKVKPIINLEEIISGLQSSGG